MSDIKLKRYSASVKGTIWNLIGIFHKKFGAKLKEFLVESQYKKPEFRTIIGMTIGLSYSLKDE